jgi:signal transduction histidine kinase
MASKVQGVKGSPMNIEPTAQAEVRGATRRNGHVGRRTGPQPFAARPRDTALLRAMTIIAHDLRGPLANLSILIELMEAYIGIDAHEQASESALKAQRTIGTVTAMLDGFLERVWETGDPLDFAPGVVDLGDVIEDSVALSRPLAEARGVTLRIAKHGLAVIGGDRRLLVEAVDNLIGNAVKHAPRGSEVLCAVDLSTKSAVVRIVDQGPGLAAADLARLLKPFSMLPTSGRARRRSSFGLGLWIVRLIAERHGGRLEARAAPGQGGTCLELHLPIDFL